MGEPARGYTRTHPPFEPGNLVALKHGACSPRTLRPLAEAIAREVVEAAPHLEHPRFAAAVEAYAWAEAEVRQRRAWLDEQGLLSEAGEERVGAERRERAEARAAKLRASLGVEPMAAARLVALVASVDNVNDDAVQRLVDEGERILAARRATGELPNRTEETE